MSGVGIYTVVKPGNPDQLGQNWQTFTGDLKWPVLRDIAEKQFGPACNTVAMIACSEDIRNQTETLQTRPIEELRIEVEKLAPDVDRQRKELRKVFGKFNGFLPRFQARLVIPYR